MLPNFLAVFLSLLNAESPFEEAPAYLSGVEGLRLEEESLGKFSLQGQIQRQSDKHKVKVFLERHPEVKNKTKLAPEIRSKNKNEVPMQNGASNDSSILFELVIAEVKKSALERLGTRLPHLMSVGLNFDFKVLGQGMDHMNIANSDPLRAFLDAAVQSGFARIHARQSIVVQNRKWGEFKAGGELPLKIVSSHSSRVEFKEYGLLLKILPEIKSANLIHLSIDSEISDLDLGGMVDGMPMISKKHLKTELVTPLGQMIALGGLIRETQSKYIEEFPGLSALPLLGRLFKSDDFRKHQSEAYIFAAPQKLDGPWLPTPTF